MEGFQGSILYVGWYGRSVVNVISKKRLLLLLCISVERGFSSRRSLLEGDFWKVGFSFSL